MPRLSVNINKIATIRNARGGGIPNVARAAKDCERFGADGITVHPRPDGRHIIPSDVVAIKKAITTELNVEGYPDKRFMDILRASSPAQATLVPDAPDVLTSTAGWDTVRHSHFLKDVVQTIHAMGIRVSLFVEPDPQWVEAAKVTGADGVELYTGSYATAQTRDRIRAIKPYVEAAQKAHQCALRVHAGHDLTLDNVSFFCTKVLPLHEVSIGHALICDALQMGLQQAVRKYRKAIDVSDSE